MTIYLSLGTQTSAQYKMIARITAAVILLVHVISAKDFATLKHLRSNASPDVQAKAAHDLITRFIGERSSSFMVTINPKLGPAERDTFEITMPANTVNITATTGVAAAMGFYYYLKTYCGCQITWGGQQLALPAILPNISSTGITITTNDKFRYYQNVCTVSYSFVWFQWLDWQKQIDWMAISGINLPLAFTAQEAIFQRVFMRMGFTMEDLQEFFGGPAFFAWTRMGNIQGWGGPISQMWLDDQLVLQHRILGRMRDLGMVPVLPGFAGHVPGSISRLYPNANVSRLDDWAGFNLTYCCTYLLDFEDPLFEKIGSELIHEMMYEFGVDHIYNADSFNEMVPKTSDVSYLANAGRGVYKAMASADPQAIWLMQGWLFQNTQFWKAPQIKALLTSVEPGRMLVLDLFSEVAPVFLSTESYYGQPFIWCMLHDFGGTLELYGNLQNVNDGPFFGRTFPNSTMVGIGLTPEGIFQNEVIYEFMNENAYTKEPREITKWISDYAKRRYGGSNQYTEFGWQLLRLSVYSATIKHHGHNGFIKRPHLKPWVQSTVYHNYDGFHDNNNALFTMTPAIGRSENVWYDPELLYKAWDNFILASDSFSNSSLFRYDLVDVTRNSLQILSIKFYEDIIDAYSKFDSLALSTASDWMLQLLEDLDVLLSSDPHFLLGSWIKAARAWGTSKAEKDLYEYNMRNQVTIWGPRGEIIDYAAKQWSGVVTGYYRPRWELFVGMLNESVENATLFNQTEFNILVRNNVEIPFSSSQKKYPSIPVGDSIAIAKKIHQRYRDQTRHSFFGKLYTKSVMKQREMAQKYDHWTRLYLKKYGQLPIV